MNYIDSQMSNMEANFTIIGATIETLTTQVGHLVMVVKE